jgi:hypothetical protein
VQVVVGNTADGFGGLCSNRGEVEGDIARYGDRRADYNHRDQALAGAAPNGGWP